MDERIMEELLDAAQEIGAVTLSLAATMEIESTRASCGTVVSNWAAVYVRTARQLRERCIRAGMPRQRYLTSKWVHLGL